MISRLAPIAPLLLAVVQPAACQTLQRWSVQGSAAVILPVSTPEGLESDAGLGYDVQVRYTFSRWSVGLGYQRSDVYQASDVDLTIALSLAFLEPRYVAFAGSGTAIYLAGRGGAGKLVCSRDRCDDELHIVLGGGGGLLVRLGERVNLDLGGQYFVVTDASSSDYATARLGIGVGL